MLIPLNPTLKPWADITSQGVFNGLINGVGAYIRGDTSGMPKMFGNDEAYQKNELKLT